MKLTKEQISEIIFQKDKPIKELAMNFKVSPMAIYYHIHPELRERSRVYRRTWYKNLSLEKKKQLLNKWREYQRTYHQTRYTNDPEVKRKQLSYSKKVAKEDTR